MPRVNVTLTAEELAHVDATRGRHSRSSRVAEIVAASRDALGAGEKLRSAGLLSARGVEGSLSDVIDEVTRLRHGRTEAIKALGIGNEVFDRDGLDVAESIRQLRRRLDGDSMPEQREGCQGADGYRGTLAGVDIYKPRVAPVSSTRRDGTDIIDTGGERYTVEFAEGDAVLDGVRLPPGPRVASSEVKWPKVLLDREPTQLRYVCYCGVILDGTASSPSEFDAFYARCDEHHRTQHPAEVPSGVRS